MESKDRARSYRFTSTTLERLNKLQSWLPTHDQTTIIETAIGHLLGAFERDDPVRMTVPSEGQRAHNKSREEE